MDAALETTLRDQLLDRRERLVMALRGSGEARDLLRLLGEVDTALQRAGTPGFGLCAVCHTGVGEDDLRAHPALEYCLCDLSPAQQSALQDDLLLASRVQFSLLPPQDLRILGWEAHFRYDPAGPVSGDICDLVVREAEGRGGSAGEVLALVGDVSGKGVAASLLMARLSALLRSLIASGLPLADILERSNQLFAENKLRTHYATLVAARATGQGELEIRNAGHCRPLLVRGGKVSPIDGSGFPLGLPGAGRAPSPRLLLDPGDTLVLYTDGLTEAFDRDDREYGVERLVSVLGEAHTEPPGRLAAACLADLAAFLGGAPRGDDLTLLVLRRSVD